MSQADSSERNASPAASHVTPASVQNDMMAAPGSVSSFVQLLLNFRYVFLGLSVVLTLFSWGPASRLELERSLESLFAPGHPLLAEYQQSKQLFGGDEFVMVAWQQDDLLAASGLKKVSELAEEFQQIPGVNQSSTQTLSSLLQPHNMKFLAGIFLRIPAIRQQVLSFAEGAVIGADHKTTAIILRLFPENEASVSRDQTILKIRELAAAQSATTYVAGEPVQIHDMFSIVEQDGVMLGWASTFTLLLVIFLLFRSLRWMLLPIVVVQMSLLWTKALLVVSGIRLSMVSSMFDSLITILGIATVMHITVTYRRYRLNQDRETSLALTLTDLLPYIFWMCVTTAVGFGALMSSQIAPVYSFGLMMVIGTFVMLCAVIMLIPGLVLLGNFSIDPGLNRWEKFLTSGLQKLLDLALARPYQIALATTFLAILAVIGTWDLKVETDFSKNFHDNSPIVQSLQFVETNLGGAGFYEVSFDYSDLHDSEQLEKIRRLSQELRELKINDVPVLTKVISYTDGLDFIPNLAARSAEEKQELLDQMQPEFRPNLYSAEHQRMRIVLRAYERQPAEQKLEAIHQVRLLASQHFSGVRVTGLYVLLANVIQSLLSDQLVSFLLAGVGIFLMMSIAFRSPMIGLISLVPNLFPIVVMIGGIGWSGALINIGTAMIASVSVGLTVDSSIHYMAAYRRARQAGMNHQLALQQAQGQTGLALVFSNLALVCGFSVLLLSNFVPLNYFGVLVSIAMLGGLLGNILLLPLLLTCYEDWQQRFTPLVQPETDPQIG